MRNMLVSLFVLIALLMAACGSATPTTDTEHIEDMADTGPIGADTTGDNSTDAPADEDATTPTVLRLATTTSTADSGLLDEILPDFEAQYKAQVDVVAVGTGQAIALGENGDADIIMVHARQREDEFVDNGFGVNRRDVMYNDFVIVGPGDDPASIRDTPIAADAFQAIAAANAPFAARGDDSGTSTKELGIWESAGITPSADLQWYNALGQGMGETLIVADELLAYTLTDRGTYLSMQEQLPNLEIMVGGASIEENEDTVLYNPYGIIPVNPELHTGINAELAEQFAEWITSAAIQDQIGEFGIDTFGQPLFFPNEE